LFSVHSPSPATSGPHNNNTNKNKNNKTKTKTKTKTAQHATWAGILCLLISLAGGSLYRQAPLREEAANRLPAASPLKTVVEEPAEAADHADQSRVSRR